MLRTTYPAIISKNEKTFTVIVPQFNITASADSQASALESARDSICAAIAELEDTGREVPEPKEAGRAAGQSGSVVMIFVDLGEYRKQHGSRCIRKSCTIPQWMEAEARRRNINFSQTLQNALLSKFHMDQ